MAKMSDAGHDIDASSSTLRISKVYECPVCFVVYDRTTHLPKCLRCGHTTCLACVKQLVVQSTRLRCPSCRKEHSLENAAEDLPTNFSLLEALDTMCVECHGQCVVEENTKKCQGCVERFISSSMKKFHESVESFNANIAKLKEESQKEKIDAKAMHAEANKLMKQVPKVFAKYHKALDRREKKQKLDVGEQASKRIKQENSCKVGRREELEVIEKKLQEFVSVLQMKQPEDIAATMKHVEHLRSLSKNITKLIDLRSGSWQRVDNSLRMEFHECEDLINTIKSTSALSRWCGSCKDERVMSVGLNDLSTYDMWYGSPIVSQILDESLDKPQDVAVSPVDGTVVVANEGSRSLVFFVERSKTSDEEENENELGYDCWTPYEFQKVVENLGEDKSQFFGITIAENGHIFVTDVELHCVWVLDKNGAQVNKIGTKGKGQLEFDYPAGITIDVAAGHLYICDFENDRIQVITTDGRFVRSFGLGSAGLQLSVPHLAPWYIAVEAGKSGKVYFVTTYSTLHIFSKSGKFVRADDLHGEAEYGLALDAMGNLLTASFQPNVLLRSTNFQLVIKIGADNTSYDKKYHFGEVRGIAVNKNGNMIVCDHSSNTLKVLVEKVVI